MRRYTLVSILVFSFLFATGGASWAQKLKLSIGGSGVGSVAFTLVAGMAENTNSKSKLVNLTPETTAGFVENIRRLGTGEMEFALIGSQNTYEGLRGIGPYRGEKPYTDIYGAAVVYVGNVYWCARPGIEKVTDLAGQRVSLGPPGSNIALLGEKILDVYGVKNKVKKILHLSYEEGSRAFVDGEIDAFMGGPAPYPSVMQAGVQKKINILPVDLNHIKMIQKTFPTIMDTLRAGVYEWLKKDTPAVGYLTYLGVHKKVPDNAVHDVLTVNLSPEGVKYLKNNHSLWSMWDTKMYIEKQDAFAIEDLKLHPGAVKYWREKGVKIPAVILP